MTLSIKQRCVEVGECWEWATDLAEHGRRNPSVRINGKVEGARRYAYVEKFGPVRTGYVLTQTCDNDYCLNPDHQKQVTHKAAVQRAARRGRLGGGTAQRTKQARRRAKLTLEAVREIRASTDTGPVLAQRYGVDKSTISLVRRGSMWKDHQGNPFAGLMG